MLIVIRLVFSAGLALVASSLALYFSDREAQLANDLLTHGIAAKAVVQSLREHDCSLRTKADEMCGAHVVYSFTDSLGTPHDGAGEIDGHELAPLVAGSTAFRPSPSLRSLVKFDRVPVPGATVNILYRENDPSTNYLRSTLINWTWQDPLLLGLIAAFLFFLIYYWTGLMASAFLGVPRERWLVWLEKDLNPRNRDIEFLD
jgi:hypothetical protein